MLHKVWKDMQKIQAKKKENFYLFGKMPGFIIFSPQTEGKKEKFRVAVISTYYRKSLHCCFVNYKKAEKHLKKNQFNVR